MHTAVELMQDVQLSCLPKRAGRNRTLQYRDIPAGKADIAGSIIAQADELDHGPMPTI